MGCSHSKCRFRLRKNKNKKSEAQETCSANDDGGKFMLEQQSSAVDKQLETYEKQLKVLEDVAALSGSQEREQILTEHQHEELFKLIFSITEKVKNETAAELQALHEEQIKNCTEQHHKQTEELQSLHSDEMHSLQAAHTAVEGTLKGQIEELTADNKEYRDLKQRVNQSMWKKDLQRNLETHGSPGEFWEQEHESLLAVIEMKSERVQGQQHKLLQLEELIQKNLTLENQVHLAQRQNEDLKYQIDKQQALICQLYSEQNALQEALEKQTLETQRLIHMMDELQYKIRDGQDSCTPVFMPTIGHATVALK